MAYPRLNVKVVGSHAGLTVGEDGATHQASVIFARGGVQWNVLRIAEVLAKFDYPVPQEFVGVDDVFGHSGHVWELLEKYGLSLEDIAWREKKAIVRKQKNKRNA